MKRRLIAILLAGIMVLTAGCSANVSVDPDTGVVSVNGMPVNELMKDLDPDILKGSDKTDDNNTDEGSSDKIDDGVTEYTG
ncbi:MAG: hypothetical protein K6E53_16335, partial [Lachnospiraceae bacterium]|nr:hypothetical protein [Lachnospiraceae bacterium]